MRSMSTRTRVGVLLLVGGAMIGCATPAPTRAPISPSALTPSPTPAASVAASPASTPSTSPVPSGPAAALTVEARDLSFAPTQLEAAAGRPFELTLHNAGVVVHNVTIDSPRVQLVVSPGKTGTTLVEGLAPGSYAFYCSVSGHRLAGMSGTLTVR